jgi:hypothetical protein
MNSDLKRSYSTTSDAYFNFHPRLAVEERHAHYRQTRREARSPQDLNEPHHGAIAAQHCVCGHNGGRIVSRDLIEAATRLSLLGAAVRCGSETMSAALYRTFRLPSPNVV